MFFFYIIKYLYIFFSVLYFYFLFIFKNLSDKFFFFKFFLKVLINDNEELIRNLILKFLDSNLFYLILIILASICIYILLILYYNFLCLIL